jgi:hypothetical protein
MTDNKALGWRNMCPRSGWDSIFWAGVTAGSLAALFQALVWISFTDDFPAVLYRDARLTAAVILGTSVLPPPATFDVSIMLTATLVHFGLSFFYAGLLAASAPIRNVSALLLGITFGIVLYLVNLYGFTLIFPWFTHARGWITLVTHVVFGVSLTCTLKYFDTR